jgi:flagellar motor switch/type III secretory pathway protein FliN
LARGGERTRLARYASLCTGAGLALIVGETEVDAAGLSGLEPGDVVVVERVFGEWGDWAGGDARGTLRARGGAGDNVLVVGARAAVAEGDGGSGALRLVVEEVSASEAREGEAWRLRMEDESELAEESGAEAGLLDNLLLTLRVELPARRISLEELTRLRAGQVLELDCRATDPVDLVAGSDEGAGLLDTLLLTVRVELPARRISLEELTRLRAGQILELDCRATDPVELVADGRRVATGELVDIEGRLGVRVTRLAG